MYHNYHVRILYNALFGAIGFAVFEQIKALMKVQDVYASKNKVYKENLFVKDSKIFKVPSCKNCRPCIRGKPAILHESCR